MDIPSLFMIPSAVSSGKVHSVFPNSTDADFQFNRDSDATRVNSEGLIERVGYYSAERVTNGGFDTDSNWSKDGWKIENGKAINTLASSGLNLYQGSVTSVGNTFKVVLDAVISAGGLKVLLGGGSGGYNEIGQASSTGTHTFTGVSNGTDNRILIQTLSGSTIGSVIVDNVSVKQINGDRARLNYEIEGGLVNTKPSLLLEPQSTNLVTYSEDFSNWSTINATSTSNYSISPSGELNASRFLTSGESNSYLYVTGISTTASQQYTVSFYVKSNKNGLDDFKIYTSLAGGDSVVFTATENWQRFDHTVTATSTSIFVGLRGVSGKETDVLVYGAQFEQLSYPTSLIITNGSVQTRTSETCNGAGTSSILPSEEGILYAEIQGLNNGTNQRWIALGSGSNANRVSIHFNSTNNINCSVRGSSSARYDANFNIGSQTNNTKAAIRYKDSDYSFFVNGVKVDSQQSNSLNFNASLSELAFDSADSASYFYGKCKDIRVYNTKEMTDSEVDILLNKITS